MAAANTLRVRFGGGVAGMILFIAFLHLAGWGTLIAFVAPKHLSVGTTAFGFGLGLTAYMLGVRHAFDADHIAAIDNTARKLMQDGRNPLQVGFWFSCGHSTIVCVLALCLALGIHAVDRPILNNSSALHNVTALVGTIVSSGFLYIIAALNIVVLMGVWKVFRSLRTGRYDDATLATHLNRRGLVNRLLGRVMNIVTEPWQMYVVGLLFGLGFDTATEIALLVLTGSGAASGVPWYAIMCLPVLFTAGMSLFDTLDASFMTSAYSWGLSRPGRKIYYNFVITSLSVVTAFMIGTVEILGLLSKQLELRGRAWSWIANIDLNKLGFLVVAVFSVTFLGAVLIWKYARLDERWDVEVSGSSASD